LLNRCGVYHNRFGSVATAPAARGSRLEVPRSGVCRRVVPASVRSVLHAVVSAIEKAALEKKREELYKARSTSRTASARPQPRRSLRKRRVPLCQGGEPRIQRELAELEAKLKNSRSSPTKTCRTTWSSSPYVRLQDLDDDSAIVQLVGEAQHPGGRDVLPVSANSPMAKR